MAAIIERQGLVLMVRHRSRDESGHHFGYEYLTLPGGGIEPDESPADAVTREVAEEVGLRVATSSFLRRIEHREREHAGGATSIFYVTVEDGTPTLGTDPELTCSCPHLVGIDWIAAPGRADWEGPDAWSFLKVRLP